MTNDTLPWNYIIHQTNAHTVPRDDLRTSYFESFFLKPSDKIIIAYLHLTTSILEQFQGLFDINDLPDRDYTMMDVFENARITTGSNTPPLEFETDVNGSSVKFRVEGWLPSIVGSNWSTPREIPFSMTPCLHTRSIGQLQYIANS